MGSPFSSTNKPPARIQQCFTAAWLTSARCCSPTNLSMAEVSRREGVSEMSLSNWRKQLSSEGSAASENKQSTQNWSAETQFAVVLEAAVCPRSTWASIAAAKAFTPSKSLPGDKPSSPAGNRKRPSKKTIGSSLAKIRNASRNLSANCAAKTRRSLKQPRCWCREKRSTTTGGPTTRTTDVFARTAVAS